MADNHTYPSNEGKLLQGSGFAVIATAKGEWPQ
jgi:hypothetical protein